MRPKDLWLCFVGGKKGIRSNFRLCLNLEWALAQRLLPHKTQLSNSAQSVRVSFRIPQKDQEVVVSYTIHSAMVLDIGNSTLWAISAVTRGSG